MGLALSAVHLFQKSLSQTPQEEKPTVIRKKLPINESLLEVFSYLDRDNLDVLQYTCRRFKEIVDERMQLICLRPLCAVSLTGDYSSSNWPRRPVSYYIASVKLKKPASTEEQPNAEFHNHDELLKAAEWLLIRLRSGVVVDTFTMHDVPITWDLIRLFSEKGSRTRVTGEMCLHDVDASPASLMKFFTEGIAEIRTIRLNDYNYSTFYRPAHLTNELLKKLAAKGVAKAFFPDTKPEYAETYQITDDGILDFILAGEVECPDKEVEISHVQLTPQFFNRLVQSCKECKQKNRIRLKLTNLRPHNQDTTEYDNRRKQLTHCQLFDFKEDVRFQILIYQPDPQDLMNSTLELRRGPEPKDGTDFFY